MDIQVIKGFNARRPRLADGTYAGFTPLLPGTYSGEIDGEGDLILQKANGEAAFIPPEHRQQKIEGGDLVFLNH